MAKYDFMSFGEAMVRFTPPGHDRLGQAEVLELGIAAAELKYLSLIVALMPGFAACCTAS